MQPSHNGAAVRVITRDGEPWFVAADVCAALDLSGDPGQHTRRLDDDEKGLSSIQTLGGTQQVAAINESGLYSLILGSRKPEAKRFKKWVTAEVLPAIRKTGKFFANKGTRELVDELRANSPNLESSPVKSLPGAAGGTFVAKELVYAYAMWISPAFSLKVIRCVPWPPSDGIDGGAPEAGD